MIDNLSQSQIEVVKAPMGGAIQVLASAGSGKTRVLTERVRFILNNSARGSVVALTFTNKAADELVNPDLVVPDDVTKGEIVQNVSQDADAQYQKNWTEFKAACD